MMMETVARSKPVRRNKLISSLIFPAVLLIWLIAWCMCVVGDRSEGNRKVARNQKPSGNLSVEVSEEQGIQTISH